MDARDQRLTQRPGRRVDRRVILGVLFTLALIVAILLLTRPFGSHPTAKTGTAPTPPRGAASGRTAATAATAGTSGATAGDTAALAALDQLPWFEPDGHEVHLHGVTLPLPDGWDLTGVEQAGAGAVVSATVSTEKVVAYVDPTGAVTRLAAVRAPFVVNRAGTEVAGLGTSHGIVVLALPSGRLLFTRGAPSTTSAATTLVSDFVDDHTVIAHHQGRTEVVDLGRGTVRALTGRAAGRFAVSIGGRDVVVLDGAEVARVDERGRTQWHSRLPGNRSDLSVSPDGSRVGVLAYPTYALRVVDSATGRVIASTPALPEAASYGDVSAPYWIDNQTVLLVAHRASVTDGSTLFQCSLSRPTCTRLGTAPGQPLLATQR